MPEVATGSALRKKVFLEILQNVSPVPEETPVNFAKFLKKPFLQNNSGQLHLNCGHCKNKAREIDCLCCRVISAMLIA